MGSIIRFPIIVIQDKANESRPGITPQLRDSIRATASASTSEVASERAIRDAIDNIEFVVSGENIGLGIPTLDNISGSIINFYPLSGLGNIFITSDDEQVYLNTTQTGIPGQSLTGQLITSRTLNGGIEQEASKISYSDFGSTTGDNISGSVGFHNVQAGDVIGKTNANFLPLVHADSGPQIGVFRMNKTPGIPLQHLSLKTPDVSGGTRKYRHFIRCGFK